MVKKIPARSNRNKVTPESFFLDVFFQSQNWAASFIHSGYELLAPMSTCLKANDKDGTNQNQFQNLIRKARAGSVVWFRHSYVTNGGSVVLVGDSMVITRRRRTVGELYDEETCVYLSSSALVDIWNDETVKRESTPSANVLCRCGCDRQSTKDGELQFAFLLYIWSNSCSAPKMNLLRWR